MKKLFYVGTMLLAFTACSNDDLFGDSSLDDGKSDAVLNFTTGDQSRILSPMITSNARMLTRAAADPAAPTIPDGAIEFDKELLDNSNDGVALSKGNTYKITKTYTGSVSTTDTNGTASDVINIYVAADAEFTTWWDDWRAMNANIYVLPGATLKWDQSGNDQMVKIPQGVRIQVWGDFITPDKMGLRLYEKDAALYVYNTAAESEFPISYGRQAGETSLAPFVFLSTSGAFSSPRSTATMQEASIITSMH